MIDYHMQALCVNVQLLSPLPELTNFSTRYLILSMVNTDEGGILIIPRFVRLYGRQSTRSARGLPPRTGEQTMVCLLRKQQRKYRNTVGWLVVLVLTAL